MASWEEPPLPRSFDSVFYGAAGGGEDLPSDDEFNRVSFLSHFEGANNGVNNAFDDGSTSNHTITANGNVTQGSFGPFARPDGEFGVSFDGNDYLSVAETSADEFTFGTGNFTIEGWINNQAVNSSRTIVSNSQGTDFQGLWFGIHESKYYYLYNNSGGWSVIVHAGTPVVNAWTHFAVVRNGTSNVVYINGSSIGSTTETARDLTNTNNLIAIGGRASVAQYTISTMSNVRVVKGTAVYTGNFTPSTSKLTAITNTKLLTCQSNRFVDNSASALTITPAGNAAVTAFGPFLTSAVYDAAVNGASTYFDGSGDWLQAANSADWDLGTGNFTWECYANITDITRTQWFFSVFTTSSGQNAWGLRLESNGTLNAYFSSDGGESPTAVGVAAASSGLTENAWHHIACVRNGTGSNNIQVYVDGVSKVTGTFGAIFDTNLPFRVGRQGNTSTPQYFLGYISDVRIVKGTAVYTGNFTPPTAPLTAITNTKMLLNMADGQAIDSAAQNNMTLLGNTKLSTTQAKFGDTSMLFATSEADKLDLGDVFWTNSDWTHEFWIYLNSNSTATRIIFTQYTGQVVDGRCVIQYINSTGKIMWFIGISGANITVDVAMSKGAWHHVALTRSGNDYKLFVDGTAGATGSSSQDLESSVNTILGPSGFSTQGQGIDGFIDDLRFSKFVRYTSDFTPPSEPFADKGQ